MATTAAELVIVDTNILLAATDTSRESHDAALAFLNGDPRRLALTPQIVREYLVVATRPVEVNGLGLAPAEARANVDDLMAEMTLLREDAATTRLLTGFVAAGEATGKQIHDANVVAAAIHHDAVIVTDDSRHFARFADRVAIEPLNPLNPLDLVGEA